MASPTFHVLQKINSLRTDRTVDFIFNAINAFFVNISVHIGKRAFWLFCSYANGWLHYYIWLHVTTCYYMLLHVTTCYYMLLHVTTCYYMLLHVTTCYYMLLHVTTCYYMLLHVTTCYYMLLHATYDYINMTTY
jgi:hypothetical protein